MSIGPGIFSPTVDTNFVNTFGQDGEEMEKEEEESKQPQVTSCLSLSVSIHHLTKLASFFQKCYSMLLEQKATR